MPTFEAFFRFDQNLTLHEVKKSPMINGLQLDLFLWCPDVFKTFLCQNFEKHFIKFLIYAILNYKVKQMKIKGKYFV